VIAGIKSWLRDRRPEWQIVQIGLYLGDPIAETRVAYGMTKADALRFLDYAYFDAHSRYEVRHIAEPLKKLESYYA
jgi:hypothetical protein